MKPIIGINVDIEPGPAQAAIVQGNYFHAVLKAGGIPVLIPPMPDDDLNEVLARINGLLLIGGNDYDPKHYHEQACKEVKLAAPARDDFDLRLIQRAVVGSNVPVLGICAGAQALNIGLGGSLYQDIPSEFPASKVEHSSKNGWESGWHNHVVKLEPQSKLAKIYPKLSFAVPTSHHQSVKRLGAGLTACAHAEDGVIEAVEYADKPFAVGVQWHPERDFDNNKPLFDTFIKFAAARSPVASR
jgi:gamma-glutamyl-gamma-aminobutyrate hydrolase PuuD